MSYRHRVPDAALIGDARIALLNAEKLLDWQIKSAKKN